MLTCFTNHEYQDILDHLEYVAHLNGPTTANHEQNLAIKWWVGAGILLHPVFIDAGELRENAIFVIFLVPLLRKTTKNWFRELSIFVSSVHFYVISTEFEKLIERSI
jgi:hypothetical protein